MLASVAAYSAVADRYEATHASKGRARVERFAGSLPTPSLILDAGCGPGRDLARFTALGHVARGIDLNPEFVARANVYAPTWCGDLREVVRWFPPHMFDGIWADAALVHLSDVEAADVLGQFHELLRPVGRLYAGVHAEGDPGWRDEADGRRWYSVWDPEAFAAAVASAGFGVDDVAHGPFVEVWATRDR